jgi:hypothetical protein
VPTFRLDELGKFEEWVRSKAADGLKRGLASAALRTLGAIQNEIIPAEDPQPVDRGAFRAGWRIETHDKGTDIVNDLPYAPVIDRGARPEAIKIGTAMIQALAEWAKRKGFSPAGIPKGGDPEKAWESVAWAIAVNMKKSGIFQRNGVSGLRISEKAVKRLKEFLPEEIRREVERA